MTRIEVLAHGSPTKPAIAGSVPSLASRMMRVALALSVFVLAACSGDSPTSPRASSSIDRVAAARVVPSVTDARVRLASVIENIAVRDRVTHDLLELENALTNGDGDKARFHTHVLVTIVTEYRAQQGSVTTDGADVTAITLMLRVASQVVDAGYELPLSP